MAELGFDLTSKLGELLAEQNDLSDLRTIKVALLALFLSDARLRSAFDDRALWALFQQRHLIVHRQGIVDRRYLEATDASPGVGEPFVVTPRELIRHIETVVAAASGLFEAVEAG